MQSIMVKRRTISVDDDLCGALKRIGKMGDTYSDVIRQLVKDKEQRAKK
jgi:predicted CopG family antitoxin